MIDLRIDEVPDIHTQTIMLPATKSLISLVGCGPIIGVDFYMSSDYLTHT